MRMNKGQPFMDVEADSEEAPVFSEAFLYDTVGKGDARFILGVAEEYEHIIEALGPTAVRALLDIKPRLVQRLGVPELLTKELADANSEDFLRREQELPSQVVLDEKAAYSIWYTLHQEYQRFFNPEEAMNKDSLRAYHTLTDGLGQYEQELRQKEIDRLPEKLAKQEERREELRRKREERKEEAKS